jgi:hypothetical protein
MKTLIKILLSWLLFIACGAICYAIFRNPDSFTNGFLGALTSDYLYFKYKEY